jgi:S-adenosylmethionine uptake transporter
MRTLADVASAYFFLTALLNMPLADATAIIQVLPLTVTLGAALLFREKVGWRRLLAIGGGFIGVMLIPPDAFECAHAYYNALQCRRRDGVCRDRLAL